MVFPVTEVTPQSASLQFNYSTSLNKGRKFQQKFIPKNPDGTPTDCTAATGSAAFYSNGQAPPFNLEASDAPNVVLADATGVILDFSDTFVYNLAQLGYTRGQFMLTITDGTTDIQVGVGSYQISVQP